MRTPLILRGGRLATKTVKVLKNSAKIVVLKGKTAEKLSQKCLLKPPKKL
jgi:hypothetical protein